jgi:hypothetical protein
MAHQREHEFPPLLFNLTPTASHPQSELKTPGAAFPIAKTTTPRGGESSLSTARRSVTTPGSAHTEATPSRPPPLMRLADAGGAGGALLGSHGIVGPAIDGRLRLLGPAGSRASCPPRRRRRRRSSSRPS